MPAAHLRFFERRKVPAMQHELVMTETVKMILGDKLLWVNDPVKIAFSTEQYDERPNEFQYMCRVVMEDGKERDLRCCYLCPTH